MSDQTRPETYRLALNADEPVPELFRNAVIAIGSFDGVHIGHQGLIEATVAEADGMSSVAIALTFEPHPRTFFRPAAPVFRLTSAPAKRILLGIAGAKGVVEARFDRDLSRLKPVDFVKSVLVDRLSAAAIVVGDGFRFGKDRGGDTEILRSLCKEAGFGVEIVSPITDQDGRVISSGLVRDGLRNGDIDLARAALGYLWFITGTVVDGEQRGRDLGYPTANLALPDAMDLRHGVYAVAARWDGGTSVLGVASYGIRPTFGGGEPILEVHLFDFSGNLYGKDLAIVFHGWLRPEERFDSTASLVRQMAADADRARAIHAGANAGSMIDRALAHSL